MKFLVTGAKSQLGTELCKLLDEKQLDYIPTDKDELDITNEEDVRGVFSQEKPNVIFHCAAYTAVDAAEETGKELNYLINEKGTENVAEIAKEIGQLLSISVLIMFLMVLIWKMAIKKQMKLVRLMNMEKPNYLEKRQFKMN